MKLSEVGNRIYIEGEVECNSCKGTGLYFGMAERDGARVICHTCDGTGKNKVKTSWNKFTGRKTESGAKRVYSNGMGYCITAKDVKTKEGKLLPFSQYGCSYEEWLSGKSPKPLEFLGCPYQETNQSLQGSDKNKLYKSRCSDNLGWGMISNCKLYHDKVTCWKIYNQ